MFWHRLSLCDDTTQHGVEKGEGELDFKSIEHRALFLKGGEGGKWIGNHVIILLVRER